MEEQKILLKWVIWPAKKQIYRSFFAYIIIISCIVFAAKTSLLLAVFMTVAFFISVGEVLLPSQYTITEQGISIYSIAKITTKKWTDFSKWKHLERGFLLIGKGSRSFLIKRRSMMVYCFDEQDQLKNILQQFLSSSTDEISPNQ